MVVGICVLHHFLLHGYRSPNSIQPRAMCVLEGGRTEGPISAASAARAGSRQTPVYEYGSLPSLMGLPESSPFRLQTDCSFQASGRSTACAIKPQMGKERQRLGSTEQPKYP
jgi:hypothetical protein